MMIGPSYTISSASTKGGSNASHLLYNTILFNGKYQYFRNSTVKLYAHVGVGVEITHFSPKFLTATTRHTSAGRYHPSERLWTSTATSACLAKLDSVARDSYR